MKVCAFVEGLTGRSSLIGFQFDGMLQGEGVTRWINYHFVEQSPTIVADLMLTRLWS